MRLRHLVPVLFAASLAVGAEAIPTESPQVISQADALAKARQRPEAIALLDAWLKEHPQDQSVKRHLLALQVAQKEDEIRGLIKEQAGERELMLADAEYEEAKARAEVDVSRRLSAAEYLVSQGRPTDALETVNRILRDHPNEQAALLMKIRLLDSLSQKRRESIKRERDVARGVALDDVSQEGTFPDEKAKIRRQVFVFDEDLDELERARVTNRLQEKVSLTHDKAKVWDVMQQLFSVAGINYVVLDSAIGDETISLNIQDDTIQAALEAVGKLAKVRFAYNRGTVFVSSDADESLVTEIIRLKSGLTNVEAGGQTGSFQSGGSSGTAAGGANGTGGATNAASGAGAPKPPGSTAGAGGANGAGGAGAGGKSDLEKFLDKIPDIVVGWPADGKIYLDRKSNTVYVRSTPWGISELKRLLQALDYNNAQILINAKFVEVSEDATRDLGIEWGAFQGKDQANKSMAWAAKSGSPSLPSTVAAGGGGTALAAGLLSTDSFTLNATIRALEVQKKADSLAEPRILALNNSQGVIEIVRKERYVSSYTFNSISTAAQTNTNPNINNNNTIQTAVPQPQYDTAESGYQLLVTPSIARNSDNVTLKLKPTVQFVDLVPDEYPYQPSQGATIEKLKIKVPNTLTRTLETTLHIKNGQTVALGGLISESDSKTDSHTPFLASIPVLGNVFRNTSASNSRSNLIILVTADIVDPTGARIGDEIETLRDTARILLPADTLDDLDAAAAQEQEQKAREIKAAQPAAAPSNEAARPSFDKSRRP